MPESVVTFASLDDSPIQGPRTWLDATREGVFAGYPTGDGKGVQITEATIDQLVLSIKRAETPIPIDGGGISRVHETTKDSAAPAAGWILDGVKLKDATGRAHLWVFVELLPEVAQTISKGSLLFGSVAFDDHGVDTESGISVGAILHSYALTNKPFVQGLTPHVLGRSQPGVVRIAASIEALSSIRLTLPDNGSNAMSDQSAGLAQQKDGEENKEGESGMTLDVFLGQLRELLGEEAAGKTPQELLGMVKSATAQPAQPQLTPELAKDAAGLQAKVIALEEQAAGHQKIIGEFQNSRKEQDAREHVFAECKKIGFPTEGDKYDSLVSLAIKHGHEVVDTALSSINLPPSGRVMNQDSVRVRSLSKAEDAVTAELSKGKEDGKKHENDYQAHKAAIIRASEDHPGLFGV